jgi:hypothetical protein
MEYWADNKWHYLDYWKDKKWFYKVLEAIEVPQVHDYIEFYKVQYLDLTISTIYHEDHRSNIFITIIAKRLFKNK